MKAKTILFTFLLYFIFTLPCYPSDPVVRAGDILLTRNFGGEEANPSPGYYNHSAIVGENHWVIESQEIFNSVIAIPVWHFFDRYPEILVLRPKDPIIAQMSAVAARQVIGRRYSRYESIRPFFLWHSGDNCVSAVKRVYNYIGVNRKWVKPDHLMQDRIFIKVALKKDYENYTVPQDKYKGRIMVKPTAPAQ